MRRELLVVAFGLVLLAAGCGGMRAATPRSGALAVGEPLARASVLRGMRSRGFTVEADNPGSVIAALELPDLWLRIEVTYDGSSYTITYRESVGLETSVDASGATRLGAAYFRYVDQLADEIERASRWPDTLALFPPSAGGEVVTAPPPATGDPGVTAAAPAPAPAPAPSTAPVASPYVTATPGTTAYAPAAAYGPTPYTEPPRPVDDRPRRSLDEVLIPGLVIWGASWVADWATSIAIAVDGRMIGFSFIPVVGPFLQLGELQWRTDTTPGYERWTGLFYPMMGLVQITGLVLTVVGATVQVPVGETGAATLEIVPRGGPDGAGLDLHIRF